MESGWGEFEINIKVFFVDPTEKPLDLYHHLKLHPATPEGNEAMLNKKPIVFEQYDEIVFNSPKEEFYQILTQTKTVPMHIKGSKFSDLCKT